MREGSASWYYTLDALGSVIALTDSVGAKDVGRYSYDPYGTTTVTATTPVGRDNPFRYASGYADDATGLYKFGARYYDPSLGRWTQRDPLPGPMGFPSKVDRYSYVGDNPLSRTDPTGKDFLDDLADAAKCAAIVAALDYAGQYFVGAVLTGEEAIAAAILVIGSAAVEYYIEHCQ